MPITARQSRQQAWQSEHSGHLAKAASPRVPSDDVDALLAELREEAHAQLLDEADRRAEQESDPVAAIVHARRAARLRSAPNQQDESDVEARVADLLQFTLDQEADPSVCAHARAALERLKKNKNRTKAAQALDLLGRHDLTATEVEVLRGYVAELPSILARPLNKLTEAERRERTTANLAAFACRAMGIPIGGQGRPASRCHARLTPAHAAEVSRYSELADSPNPEIAASARRVLKTLNGGRS